MLNKHGWGLKEMLILSGILVFFLIIAIFFIVRMYNELDMQVTNKSYVNMEDKLAENARVYLDNYYDGVLTSEGIIITQNVLKAYGLDTLLEDDYGNSCTGYVKASKSAGITNVLPYIKCNNYTTIGY